MKTKPTEIALIMLSDCLYLVFAIIAGWTDSRDCAIKLLLSDYSMPSVHKTFVSSARKSECMFYIVNTQLWNMHR